MSDKVQDTSANDDLSAYDPSKYSTVCPDSNCQSTVTTGGEDHLVVKSGGSDLAYQDSAGTGGVELL